jgi:hypothetical protein
MSNHEISAIENNEGISFEYARRIAERAILNDIYHSGQELVDSTEITGEYYMESDFGWIFFGSRKNLASLEQFQTPKNYYAYRVDKGGICNYMIPADDAPDDIAEYFEVMSDKGWTKNTRNKEKIYVPISFVHARMIAENSVLRDICCSNLQTGDVEKLLEEDYLEAECCWIFLRNKNIVVPPQNWFAKAYGAYAVSKKGVCYIITHFADEPERLKAYLQMISDHFKKNGT